MVLFRENSCAERVGRIVSRTGTTRCRTIGPPSSSVVTRCTVTPADLHAVLECLSLRIHAGERRAEATDGCSGCDWEKPRSSAGPSTRMNPARHTNPTLSSEAPSPARGRSHRVKANRDGSDRWSRYPARRARIETASILTIGDHNCDGGVETPLRDRVDQRLQIAAATGDQDTQPAIRGTGIHASRSPRRFPATTSRDSPRRLAGSTRGDLADEPAKRCITGPPGRGTRRSGRCPC